MKTTTTSRSWFGWHILLLLLAGGCSWFIWYQLVAMLEPQPRYRLTLNEGGGQVTWNLLGPWLNVGYFNNSGSTHEYRRLSDGGKIYSFKLPNTESSFGRYVSDNSEVDTLVMRNGVRKFYLDRVNPQLQTRTTLPGFSTSESTPLVSPSGTYSAVMSKISLEPFQQLGNTNISMLLSSVFTSRLEGQLFKYIPLFRVYRTSDQMHIGEMAMPGIISGWGHAKLLEDGEHILHSPSFVHGVLGEYLLKTHVTPEDKERLASNMPSLRLFNYRTGNIVREWPEIKSPSMDWIDSEHVLLHTNFEDPTTLWDASRISRNPCWCILNTRTLSLLNLRAPPSTLELHVSPHGDDWAVLQTCTLSAAGGKSSQLVIYSRAGEILQNWNLGEHANSIDFGTIPNQKQVLVSEGREAVLPQWYNWLSRYPWLRHLTLGPRTIRSVLDLASGQKLLIQEGVWQRSSANGLYLITGNDSRPEVQLAVYDLPIIPLAWWAIWLPRLAASLPLLLWLFFVFRRKKFKIS